MTEQPRIWFGALAGLMGCAGGVDGIYAGAPLLAFLGGFFGAVCLMGAATKYKDTLRRRLGYLREPEIGPEFSAVASEHQAAAIRAFGQRVWSDGEEVAYQAGVSDTRARLQEPAVLEAVRAAVGDYIFQGPGAQPMELQLRAMDCADAALTKIAEMVK